MARTSSPRQQSTSTDAPTRASGGTIRRIGVLMALVAASLAITSALHLSGAVHGRSEPFDASHSGIAEALIGIVLAVGAATMVRAPTRAGRMALATIGFAIVGFVVGLNMTARGGDAPDIAYHVTVLPILVASFVVVLRHGRACVRRSHRGERLELHA